MARRVLVSGDVVADHYLYEAQQSLVGSSVRIGATSQRLAGGAGLLGEVLRILAVQMNNKFEVIPGIPSSLDEAASISYLVMQPCAVTKRDSNNRVWRLTQPLGVEGNGRAERAQNENDHNRPHDEALESHSDVLVIDDANLGYRRWVNRTAWPKCLRPESPQELQNNRLPEWIVLKSAAPLASGNLWHTIISGETQHESAGATPQHHKIGDLASRTILVTTIDDLRLEGIRVDGQLSWDGAATDLLRELAKHPRLKELQRVRCLVVRFHLDGALVIENTGDDSRIATLVFDPSGTEGTFARQYPQNGRVLGYHTVFTAAIVSQISTSDIVPSSSDVGASILKGVTAGLSAARRLLHDGHGPVSPKVQPEFPFPKVAKEIQFPEWKFGTVVLPSRLELNWTVIGGTSSRPLWGLARQVAIHGVDQLKATPYLQFGKLFSVDRSEMESLRTLERLLTNYRRDPNATKPLSIAAFGQPGSGKSFGVKQLANALLDDPKLLEFNLSQFTDATALNGLFHQIRDEVLRGKLPVVFWDEFDSRELYWLQYLLAPMQDGTFQEGQITHPIGKCIFVFAGGTRYRFDDFGSPPELMKDADERQKWKDDFSTKKGPDFKSRLAGYINVLGPNKNKSVANDLTYPIRRALLLRVQLGLKPNEMLNIDHGLLEAFLRIDAYLHGARSLEKIAEQVRQSSRNGVFTKSDLPPAHQLALHVDAQKFLTILETA